MSKDDLGGAILNIPNIDEQISIVHFLDKKTSEIDSLIADKEKLIKLLEEQRLAIITEAVTKGLNPNVKMKDSGIKWIGEIPEHWLIIKIKYLTKIDYGLGQPPKLSEMGIPILRATNISKGKITKKDMIYAQLEDLPLERVPLLTEGEILVVRSGAYTGDSAIVTEEYSGSSPGYDLRVRATKVDSRYLAFCLLSTTVLQNQIYLEKLRAAQPHLNAEDLGRCFICLPSTLYEQEQISNSLNEKMMEFDFLIEKIQTQINKLNDYRQSLIFEAVTGKIDVSDIAVDEAVTV